MCITSVIQKLLNQVRIVHVRTVTLLMRMSKSVINFSSALMEITTLSPALLVWFTTKGQELVLGQTQPKRITAALEVRQTK